MSQHHQVNKMSDSLASIQHELNRLQTIAGTLSTIETAHYKELTNAGDDALNQIAVEEQIASRQLGEVKQICLTLAQQVQELQDQVEQQNR